MTPRVKLILQEVADLHGITVETMLSGSKLRQIAHARFHAMLSIRALSTGSGSAVVYSYPQIGVIFDKDHTSVIHGVKRAKALGFEPVGALAISVELNDAINAKAVTDAFMWFGPGDMVVAVPAERLAA